MCERERGRERERETGRGRGGGGEKREREGGVCVSECERGREGGRRREREKADWWCSLVCMLIVNQHNICTCMHDEK